MWRGRVNMAFYIVTLLHADGFLFLFFLSFYSNRSQ